MNVSIVIPAFDCAAELRECLAALLASPARDTEVIVVDDGSTDATAAVAESAGARVLRLESNRGPSAARNHGARVAHGELLVFVDADVVVAPGVVDRLRAILEDRPEISAVFGSYDANPRGRGVVSRYRNLLHHFVHQQGSAEAATFWAGCGAIRRSAFEAVGGFDERRFPRSSIEDIDLGYRLRNAGHRILLDPTIQVTHLKNWTFGSMVRTDVTRRAVPWARLIVEDGRSLDHLNVEPSQRAAALFTVLALSSVLISIFRVELSAVSIAAVGAVVFLNRRLFALFARRYGLAFAAACVPLHILYYLYSAAAYAFVRLERHMTNRRIATPRSTVALLAVLCLGLASCASGWRNCREWTAGARRDISSGNVGDVIPGIVLMAVSPVACGITLLVSPMTEVMDRPEEDDPRFVTPSESEPSPEATPAPGDDG